MINGQDATQESVERALDLAFAAALRGHHQKSNLQQHHTFIQVHGSEHTIQQSSDDMGCSYDLSRYDWKESESFP